MEFEMKSKVYIQTDTEGRIIRCEGGCTTPADLTGWIEIDEGTGDKYNLGQSHYFDGGLYTVDSIPRYKWDGSEAVLRSDEELEADGAAIHIGQVSRPSQDDISRLMVMMAQEVPGEVALSVQSMYNVWEAGKRYGYDGCEKIVKVPNMSPNFGDPYLLYRCNQPHTSQADWQPQVTPALWTRIDKSHGGGESDPIPATRGMEYVYGMYYSDPEDNGLYKCTRTGETDGGTVTLQYLPHELVGHYFVFVHSLEGVSE